MLVARIADQLGNQMFAYASVKLLPSIGRNHLDLYGNGMTVSMTATGNTEMKSIRFFRPSMMNF